MKKKPQIRSVELASLALGSALVFPYTFLPILTSPPGNQDVWVVALLSLVYILILNAPLLFLINKTRGLGANQTAEAIFGNILGKIMILPIALFCLFCFTACMLIVTRFINIYLLPDTPSWALMLFMVLPAGYAAGKGAGSIARLAFFIVPFAIFVIATFFLMGLPEMDIKEMLPILADSTFLQLNTGAFLTAARYSEIFIFFVFSNYLMPRYSINKTYTGALVTFGISFLGILVPTILVLGVRFAQIAWNPYYTFARQVSVFGFLERVQSLIQIVWFPMSLLKLSIYLYMASELFSNIFKAKSHKGFVYPLAFIGFIVGLLPFMNKSTTLAFLRSDQFMPWLIVVVVFIMPFIYVLVYLIRQKKIKPQIQKIQLTNQASSK